MGGSPVTTPHDVDYGDVQGIVRFGYGRMKEASYALARVRDVESARAWLLSVPVKTAATIVPPPPTAIQVAFTASGLEAIGVPAPVLAGFAPEFLAGMTEENRSRRLGDVGSNAPSQWEWGDAARVPHLLVMFFAEPGCLAALVESTTNNDAWNQAFDLVRVLGTADLDGIEPFGFVDGISQPEIDWSQQRDTANLIDYSNVVARGEFLLGYRNEYGKYTDRPLLDAVPANAALPGSGWESR
jgi:hypothetical protein